MSFVAKNFSRLGRGSVHRRKLLQTMTTQLIRHERIETTITKAKAVARYAEKAVTWAKKSTDSSLKKAKEFITEEAMVKKLFEDLGPRYTYRDGGYTRVLRTRLRKGDNATMAFLEFVDRPGELRSSKVPPKLKKLQERKHAADSAEDSEEFIHPEKG